MPERSTPLMTVRATYRIQFHQGFTFADAEQQVPYLASLGISHLYASPITTAQPGSTHGYDVIDPTRVNPELGGEQGFRSLVAALRAHGMGVVLDIVPNHMSVTGTGNRWWWDVLTNGPASEYAKVFDIDWSEKLLLPFLGSPLPEAIAQGDLALQRREHGLVVEAYGRHRFPVRPEDRDADTDTDLAALLDRQHYRLAWWRAANDELNWRRFFTVTGLAGVCVEDDAVFEATHELYFRLYAEGLVDGFRIDHVDGLTDPAGYCRKVRARLQSLRAGRAWIVVEKILGAGEELPRDWAVDGTSGYDFMEQVSALLHAPEGEAALTRYWEELSGRPGDFAAEELRARQDVLRWEFEGQLAACVRAFARLAGAAPETRGVTAGMLRRAITALLWSFPVYRTYGTGASAPPSDARTRGIARERAVPLAPPGEIRVANRVLEWLAGNGPGDAGLAAEAVRRFQQLSAPIAAKAVEDTAFYRYGRLLSRNDVGFDPERFSLPAAEFHSAMAARQAHGAVSMLATATHDHKRGEDVRARLAVLSEVPELWIDRVRDWRSMNAAESGLAAGDEYQLYQTLFGTWPPGLSPDDRDGLASYRDRLIAWQEKALREAKLRSSWAAPDADYEKRARELAERLLDPARSRHFMASLAAFERRLRPAADANALVQVLLRNTVPGVPDLYQGTEYRDLSLVDPDNRRAIDFAARRRSLEADPAGFDAAKQALIARTLRLRREHPVLWEQGSYQPVPIEGIRSGQVVAFERRHARKALLVAGLLHCAPVLIDAGLKVPSRDWWDGTRLLPAGAPPIEAAVLFGEAPVHVSVHVR
ncbi:MAG TPA: malto-oligosyltrehalose synthase [Woeseiaceae bacterium]|nr:malto-oligosyltrehalose synthase [Woeseiaceae bacterium]